MVCCKFIALCCYHIRRGFGNGCREVGGLGGGGGPGCSPWRVTGSRGNRISTLGYQHWPPSQEV